MAPEDSSAGELANSLLPCHNEERVTEQVQPTIELLTEMDVLHPEILLEHGIVPSDYHNGLVFRSAVESIRGRYIASSTVSREQLVREVLANLKGGGFITDFKYSGNTGRHDFTVALGGSPEYFAAIEVKGGEGNSINISERPLWAGEFAVWCHLDGAIVNQPAHGAKAIIGRLTNELVRRHKLVDMLFFKDRLCGTSARPCPKYGLRGDRMGFETAPDVFLMPQRVPSLEDPEPPVHTMETLRLPKLILESFGVPPGEQDRHIWEVHVRIDEISGNRARREVRVRHQGKEIDTSTSRAWPKEG